MKKLYLFLIIITALVAGSCSNPFTGKPDASNANPAGSVWTGQDALPEGYGAIRISFARGQARTAMPEAPGDGCLNYKFIFIKVDANGQATVDQEIFVNGEIFVLEAGSYILMVEAYLIEEGGEKATDVEDLLEAPLVARGRLLGGSGLLAPFEITSGAILDQTITMHPIVSEGVGTFSFKLIFPDDAEAVWLTLNRIDGGTESFDLLDETTEVLFDDLQTESGQSTMSGTFANVPAGYYMFEVMVKDTDTNSCIGKREVVHIYQNMLTMTDDAKYTFANGDFPSGVYLVDNTDDNIYTKGTLRYALSNIVDAATIKIMLPPGSEIRLQYTLTIDRDVTIEGNGVTITNHSSPMSDNLIEITDDKTVTIKRVHITNTSLQITVAPGLPQNAAVVYNEGNLTLESCIFSHNRVTGGGGSSLMGVAVNDSGTMTVNGCTFYDNNVTGSSGTGVIYNDAAGTLTLTGNLFVKNGSLSLPSGVSGLGEITGEYNAFDILPPLLTTATNKDGFNITDINPGTFVPENVEVDIVPSGLEVFPITDFYGNPRNGAAGAVNHKYLPPLESTEASVTIRVSEDEKKLIANVSGIDSDVYCYFWSVDGVIAQFGSSNKQDSSVDLSGRGGKAITVEIKCANYSGTLRSEVIPVMSDTDLIGIGTYLDGHWILVNDIDLTEYLGIEDWVPIGSESTPFTGTFDGNGKVIRGLIISDPSEETYQGLFGAIGATGVVKNLGLKNVDITGAIYTGGIAGTNYGTIENCFVTGTIIGGSDPTGGIAGQNSDNGLIKNCYTACDISGASWTGGVVGFNHGIVEECFSTGDIVGTNYVGGIVGYNGSIVQNCYATGDINGDELVGGIVGGNSATIRNCAALNGSISSSDDSVGRICGSEGSPSVCENNYADETMVLYVSGTPLELPEDDPDGNHGGSVASAVYTDQNFWDGTGDYLSWDFVYTWEWDEDEALPKLQVFSSEAY